MTLNHRQFRYIRGDERIDVSEERLRRELGTSVYPEPVEEEEE